MASPIGYVPAVAGIGFDNKAVPNQSQAQVFMQPVASSAWISGGSTNTNSSASGASSSFSSFTTAQFAAQPYFLPDYLSISNVEMVVSAQTVAATGGKSVGYFMGLYQIGRAHV